ncbi:MAG: radical SAM family heme chaperone HemW [Anaerolineae bacterium]|nr:radical SAM family heme chaperone HemW [Anaerolineae bacterium]
MQIDPFSIYVHIPFCRSRCSYCAFVTYAGLEACLPAYIDAVEREIEGMGQNASPCSSHTLYLGGGTPSLLSPAQVETLIGACRDHLGLGDGAEITIEANPDTLDEKKSIGYRAAGVNRLSIGVQSTQAEELRLFNRRHTAEQAAEAVQMARTAGFDNISIDLIYGAPRQTRTSWRATLDTVMGWQPEHISLYGLTLEEDTPLAAMVERGELDAPDPDLAADMYEDAQERLSRAGLGQYEISNWTRAGYASRHNRQYWLNRPYLGIGVGAHGSAGGRRMWNVTSIPEYIRRMAEGQARPFPFSPANEDYEEINEGLAKSETMILGLRLVEEGVDRMDYEARFGESIEASFGPVLRELEAGGLIESNSERIRLTRRAYLISNRVLVRFLPD